MVLWELSYLRLARLLELGPKNGHDLVDLCDCLFHALPCF